SPRSLPARASRSVVRKRSHRRSSTSSSNAPRTSNRSSAMPVSVVKACAERIDSPASVKEPATAASSPRRSTAPTATREVSDERHPPGREGGGPGGHGVGHREQIEHGQPAPVPDPGGDLDDQVFVLQIAPGGGVGEQEMLADQEEDVVAKPLVRSQAFQDVTCDKDSGGDV